MADLQSAIGAQAVTPTDGTNITQTRAVYLGQAGDLRVDMASGVTVTFVGLAAGIVHPIQVRRVYSTGTTADDIVALY